MSKQLSEKTVDALLDKLAEDDDFRSRFMANPRAATAALGTDDPAIDTLPESPIKQLAPKEEVRAARSAVRKSLLAAHAPFVPVTLDIPD